MTQDTKRWYAIRGDELQKLLVIHSFPCLQDKLSRDDATIKAIRPSYDPGQPVYEFLKSIKRRELCAGWKTKPRV